MLNTFFTTKIKMHIFFEQNEELYLFFFFKNKILISQKKIYDAIFFNDIDNFYNFLPVRILGIIFENAIFKSFNHFYGKCDKKNIANLCI